MNQESYFGIEELFISITDHRGIILSGNDVFVRVSGYAREKLIGRPHNVIRHPDMPKTAFRLVWREIQAGNIVGAYVKNRSIDGSHYWVFATILPMKDGYFSMRMKPSSAIFNVIPQLYAKMLQLEKANGMDAAESFLTEQLKSLGFNSYSDFMKAALFEEMSSRDRKMVEMKKNEDGPDTAVCANPTLFEMGLLSDRSRRGMEEVFSYFENLKELQSNFSGVSGVILKTCEQLENLSLNMSVMANKLGKEGPSLSMIALAFQKSSREISSRFAKFGSSVDEIEKATREMRFSVCVARMLVEMMHQFVDETKAKSEQQEQVQIFMRDFKILIEAVKGTMEWVNQCQMNGLQELKEFLRLTTNLRNLVLSLDLIRMGGKLEGSRTTRTEEVFVPYVNKILDHIQSIEEPVLRLLKSIWKYCPVFATKPRICWCAGKAYAWKCRKAFRPEISMNCSGSPTI